MAERVFEIRTEPHRAVIGDITLLLVPEASGGDFLTAYGKLRDMQSRVNRKVNGTKAGSTKHAKEPDYDPAELAEVSETMREFISRFLVPESVPVFKNTRLPDRVLLQLIEFAAELYGGGSGNQDAGGGTSSD